LPFTPLEHAVMQALGWDLRDIAPDLAGQFEESLPGVRRNTGAGLYTEMIVDPHRPPPKDRLTGSFGTVHAMVGDLPGSMAFKVQLRDGVLLGLEGDAFDMDTSDIDFRTTPFDRVFTVDKQGRSIAFDPAVLHKPSPLLNPQTWNDPDRNAVLEPRLTNVGALQRVQNTDNERARTFPLEQRQAAPLALSAEDFGLLLLILLGLGAVLSIPVILLRMPFGVVLIILVTSGRLLGNARALAVIRRGLDLLRRAVGLRER
jgi:hypothetical protein